MAVPNPEYGAFHEEADVPADGWDKLAELDFTSARDVAEYVGPEDGTGELPAIGSDEAPMSEPAAATSEYEPKVVILPEPEPTEATFAFINAPALPHRNEYDASAPISLHAQAITIERALHATRGQSELHAQAHSHAAEVRRLATLIDATNFDALSLRRTIESNPDSLITAREMRNVLDEKNRAQELGLTEIDRFGKGGEVLGVFQEGHRQIIKEALGKMATRGDVKNPEGLVTHINDQPSRAEALFTEEAKIVYEASFGERPPEPPAEGMRNRISASIRQFVAKRNFQVYPTGEA